MERWELPYDNGTHLVIDWRPDRRVCGRNVSSYFVDVSTSVPVLSFFARIFGIAALERAGRFAATKSFFKADEVLGLMLLSWHNIQYYQDLMADMRTAIEAGSFAAFEADFHAGQARGDIEPIGTG